MKRINLIRKIPKELYNKWFGLLLLGLLIFNIVWYSSLSSFFKVIALGLVSLFYTLYLIKVSLRSESIFPKLTYYFCMIMIWLLFSAYLASSLKEPLIAVSLFLFNLFVLIITVLMPYLSIFMKSEKLLPRLISYSVVSFLLIFLFGYLFTIAGAFEPNELGKINNIEKPDAWDFVYFSGTIFYSVNFGDYYPIGPAMRILAIVEAIFSIIIHIFLIGEIYSRSKE